MGQGHPWTLRDAGHEKGLGPPFHLRAASGLLRTLARLKGEKDRRVLALFLTGHYPSAAE